MVSTWLVIRVTSGAAALVCSCSQSKAALLGPAAHVEGSLSRAIDVSRSRTCCIFRASPISQ
jgi:hypothetical protein